MKHIYKATNKVEKANWNKVEPIKHKNNTTNSHIPPHIFDRECAEYDAGVLPFEHDKYL